MPTFRKKPVEVQAEQWLGWTKDCLQEARLGLRSHPGSLLRARIETLEGSHDVIATDWVITGVQGERYPCKDEIFRATYDPVDTEATNALEATASYHRT